MILAGLLALFSAVPVQTVEADQLAFIGLHGGVFDAMLPFEDELGVELDYLSDEELADPELDLGAFRAVFVQHVRGELHDRYVELFTKSHNEHPGLHIFDLSGGASRKLAELAESGVLEHDPAMRGYYGSSPENLRRLLEYTQITYLGREGVAQPPLEVSNTGIYHPDHAGLFPTVEAYREWARATGRDSQSPLIVVTVHSTHLAFQQPDVVDATIRECEAQGARAIGVVDLVPGSEEILLELAPGAVVHTCHSRDSVTFRDKLGVPHLHSVFFRKTSIGAWQDGADAFAANELNFQIASQEILGAIEPHASAGTKLGGGSSEAFTPIPERIERLVARAIGWAKLATKPNKDKKLAVIYYDREMGKAELMRGSATGMFMNGPRSLVNVLKRLDQAGYDISDVPEGEHELVDWMMERGRQIGVWAPDVLDRLARSGEAALVDTETYTRWFEERVPAKQRAELIKRWGPPPGKFLVWTDDDGKDFIVIPRIDLGNITLLPQPLRGEAHDTSLLHDKLVPPPHNYLATYFWLEEKFDADAWIHFGTHGSEFMLPGRMKGLGPDDWCEIVMGTTPNIQPWVINNLGESGPVRRRAHSVLIDHLVPPSVAAELSDELLNLHQDIDKWITLGEGALEIEFRQSITRQVIAEHLDVDLKFDLSGGRVLDHDEIMAVLEHLHAIHTETTPVSLHVFGEPPAEELIVPWIVTCLRSRFLEALAEVVPVPPGEALTPGDRLKFLRAAAEAAVDLVLHSGATPIDAVRAAGGDAATRSLGKELTDGFALALEMQAGFHAAGNEVDGLLAALDGQFVSPGPGSAPDRNPGVLPTGRNMYTLNPEEVPSRPSWELGKRLVDQLLAGRIEAGKGYPTKVGFTLSSFSTFEDFGVMEAQILYLIGVRPVWDARNLVVSVELIPETELGRPRIDVFIASGGYYRDILPTRMRLIDKALRLVGSLDEPGNRVFEASVRVERELAELGLEPDSAKRLSLARIFGAPPNQTGSASYYYLVERSGEWDSREELAETYIDHSKYAYTEGAWGEDAGEAYERQIQGTDTIIRSWSDRTRSPLSNKYFWYRGGSLSLAVEYLTGKEPEFLLSDVRDPDRATMVTAADALRIDLRARLFNRKWIEGMMDEGYAGADQVAVHVSNSMGWKIMRPASISDDVWEQIVDIYLRDSKELGVREWFEAENPFAFQDLTEVLLEVVRKGYWEPSDEMLREIAGAYAESIAEHGEGGGLRGGGNTKLAQFVESVLGAPGSEAANVTLASYHEPAPSEAEAADAAAAPGAAAPTPIEGRVLEPVAKHEPAPAPDDEPLAWPLLATALAAGALLGLGYIFGIGTPRA